MRLELRIVVAVVEVQKDMVDVVESSCSCVAAEGVEMQAYAVAAEIVDALGVL